MGLIVPTTIHPEREDQPLPYDCFVGIDWGSQQHQVSVLDRDRRRVGERVVDHDGASLARLADWLWTLSAGQPQRVAVAIEVPRGAMVEGLVERGFHVFALNPKQLDRFRDRHSVAGAKDDRRDAFVLADSVRTDQPSFRRVHLEEPQLLLLRELSRAEETLLEAFRRSANRLREQLHRFYPQMLQLCSAADEPWLWGLITLAPTPAHAMLLSEEQVQRGLKAHRIRRITATPVTKQSGKRRLVVMRRGCNPRLRHALYHMARVAMQRDAHFSSVYAALRAKGQRHGQALRHIGGRLLRILMSMLRHRTCYDASRIRCKPVVQMG